MGVKRPKKQKMFDQERLTHFSLRKFHTGLSSVAIATSLMFLGAAAVAADETAEAPVAEGAITAVEPAAESSTETTASAEATTANTTETSVETTTGATENIASEELTETFEAPVKKEPLKEIVEKAKVVLNDASLPEGYRQMLEEAIARGENFLAKDKLTKVELDYALSSLNSLLDTISREQVTRAATTTGTSSTDSDQHKVAATFYPMANKTTVTGSTFGDSRVVVTAGEQTAEVQSNADGSYTLDVTGGKKGLVVTADTYNADGALVGTAVAISTMSSRTNRPSNQGQAIPTVTAFRATPAEDVEFYNISSFAQPVPGSATGDYIGLTAEWKDIRSGTIRQKFTLYGQEHQVQRNTTQKSEFANRYIMSDVPASLASKENIMYYIYSNGSGSTSYYEYKNAGGSYQNMIKRSEQARLDPVQGVILKTVYDDGAGLQLTTYTAVTHNGETVHRFIWKNTTDALIEKAGVRYRIDTMIAGNDNVPIEALGGRSKIAYIETGTGEETLRVRFRKIKAEPEDPMLVGSYNPPTEPVPDEYPYIKGLDDDYQPLYRGDSGMGVTKENLRLNPGQTFEMTIGDQVRLRKPVVIEARDFTMVKGQPGVATANRWDPKKNFISAKLPTATGDLNVAYEDLVPVHVVNENEANDYRLVFDADGVHKIVRVKVIDTLSIDPPATVEVTEGTAIPAGKKVTVKGATTTPAQVLTDATITSTTDHGLTVNASGELVGTPSFTAEEWGADESKTITLTVTATKDVEITNVASLDEFVTTTLTATATVTVTVKRDTDGDGIPDERDTDDDGDGIPDIEDTRPTTQGPKDFDNLTATPKDATVQERKRITETHRVIEVNKKGTTITLPDGLPAGVSGLELVPDGNFHFKLSGIPRIAEPPTEEGAPAIPGAWDNATNEESREVKIKVTVAHAADTAKGLPALDIEVPVTIFRDTDGDGIPDTTDTDDDNDGILDVEEQDGRQKIADKLTGTPIERTLTEHKPVPVGSQVVTSNKKGTTFAIEAITKGGAPTAVEGLDLSPNADGNAVVLVGTPEVRDWADDAETRNFEESRQVTVRVKMTNPADGGNPVYVDVPVTILRDTDKDGIPDATDPDDDNDGILDRADETPKVKTDLDAVTTPQVLAEKVSVPGAPVVIKGNKPNTTYDVPALPAGLEGVLIDPATGVLSGVPKITNWTPREEERVVNVSVTVKFTSSDPAIPSSETIKSVQLTIQRDTDGDGIIDLNDDDDDNDGINDSDDSTPKLETRLTGTPAPTTITEKKEVAANTIVITSNKTATDFTLLEITKDGQPTPVTGLELVADAVSKTARLTGAAIVADWGTNEETRLVTVKVQLTHPADATPVESNVLVTILRDTDGDGTPDDRDNDDDNDGIPDATDATPKRPDELTVTTHPKTLVDKKDVPAGTDVVDTNKPTNVTFTMGTLPSGLTGLAIDPATGVLTGQPVIADWGSAEEERQVAVPVTVVHNGPTPGVGTETKQAVVLLTIQRDTDGDGIIDLNDDDDDNDGILDSEDPAKKVPNALTGTPSGKVLTEKAPVPADTQVATSNKKGTTFEIESITKDGVDTPLTGLVLVPNADRNAVTITGTPNVGAWSSATEESRDVIVKLKLTHAADAAPVFVNVPVTILRDTDGDGIPDNTGNPATSDTDDDGDGIPDVQDPTPKEKTPLAATTVDQVLKEKETIPGTPVVITSNKPNSTYGIVSLPTGLSGVVIDGNSGILSGIPSIDNWGPAEESRQVSVPVKVTFTSTDTNVPNAEAITTVTLTIYRDTDGDGKVDMDAPPATTGFTGDTDDDNDGIPDVDDTRGNGPKVADFLSGRPTPARLIEKEDVADNTNVISANKAGTSFIIESTTDRDGNAADISGLVLVPNGDFDAKLTGRPVVGDWGAEEESRSILVTVRLTNDTESATVTVPVTIYRDSDADGIIDLNDEDDDNDGIPDALDQEPATRGPRKPDPLLVTVFEKTLTDGQPVPARTDVINANKSINTTYVMGANQPHFSGVTIDPITGVLTGTPVIDNWGPTEEERYIFVPVSVVRVDDAGRILEERNQTVQLLIQRDSDGDGVPDITDTDDDNDGIPDTEDPATKEWNALTGDTTAVTVTENIETPGTETVVTANKRYNISYETGALPEHLSGLTINPTTGNLEGTPAVDNWGETEESREFTIPVTIVHSGTISERLPLELKVTVKRDSDGDRIPDDLDPDDDSDGIPDDVDSNPKSPDALTGQPTEGITLTAGQPTPANTGSVTVNKPNDISYDLGTLPTGVTGITVDSATGNLGGTPEIDNWVDGEEEREVLVPVIVRHTPSDPNVAPEEITVFVPVTIQRDSDSDGIPDVTDTDDDNDGIPDELDNTGNGPQTYDALTVTPQPVTVSAGHPVAADTALVDANKPNATYTLGGLPAGVSGLEIDQNGNIIGTPEVDWTDDAEESRTIEVEVTAKHSNAQNEEVTVTVPVTIIRDQDGDGIPDSIDNDDDGDDIPDDEDESPKTFDALTGNTGPVVIIDNKPVPAGTEQGVTGTNKPNAHYELGTLPAGLSGIAIDENGFITGTPVINNWGADEEVRDIAVPVAITRTLSNGKEEKHETTITVRVLRDTDGDGLPDADTYTTSAGVDMTGDTDDDNDDIPDTLDKRKKVFDKLAAGGTAIKLPEGADVSAIPVVTANKPGSTFAITNLPAGLTGLTITPNGDYTAGFTGTPAITNWGDTEEARTVEVEVTVTRTLSTGELETEVVKVSVTVQRDTDRDGIADTEDTDDDNDGIPDFEDTNSKAYDNLEAAGRAIVLIDNQTAAIAPALATANKYNVKYFLSDFFPYYVTGLSLTTDGMIVGTPHISNWQDGETERTFDIRVTASYGLERKTVTSTITVKRYAAGGQGTDTKPNDTDQLPGGDNHSTGEDKPNTGDVTKPTDVALPLADGGKATDTAKGEETEDKSDKSVVASADSAQATKEKSASLPNTGEAANPAAAGLAVLLSALGLMGLRRRKED